MKISTDKVDGEFVITIKCNYEIVDDCFIFANMNAPSEGKRLIMEVAGEAYENYVRNLLEEEKYYAKGTLEYLNKEFSNVKVINDDTK